MVTIWQRDLQPAHTFTVWLLAHGRLPVRARQEYLEDRLCTFCRHDEETMDHIFFRCQTVQQLWGRVRGWLQMRPQMATYRCMLRTFRRQYQGTSTLARARHLAMSAMVHHIWMARNYSMFEGKRFDGELVFRKIQIHVFRTLGVLADQVLRHE
ncbi:uncharacterized protein LOC122050457 [Zingiber officinale]|uniref:uncharacterized protein LOC122050457 n=1 Tax=Zingiber officinale TaxID=94328 RepID=UPI001C4C8738|nr:uncharacterized protein LOC122050457 [Zingiber officinale]